MTKGGGEGYSISEGETHDGVKGKKGKKAKKESCPTGEPCPTGPNMKKELTGEPLPTGLEETPSPVMGTIQLRLRKGEHTKNIRAPRDVTAGHILSKYAGPGTWEVQLCAPSGDLESLFPDTVICELDAAEPIELCIVESGTFGGGGW